MKTLKKGKKVKRVSDKEAEVQVKDHGWGYCPKSRWREQQAKEAARETKKNKKKENKK
jgi:hypothetical protein